MSEQKKASLPFQLLVMILEKSAVTSLQNGKVNYCRVLSKAFPEHMPQTRVEAVLEYITVTENAFLWTLNPAQIHHTVVQGGYDLLFIEKPFPKAYNGMFKMEYVVGQVEIHIDYYYAITYTMNYDNPKVGNICLALHLIMTKIIDSTVPPKPLPSHLNHPAQIMQIVLKNFQVKYDNVYVAWTFDPTIPEERKSDFIVQLKGVLTQDYRAMISN